ncbi:MAG: nucleotidyltransferase family protein [Nitrososphaerota archaeon]|jgi:NDP-sugar pyrophosphorylase family protein|nr:nucleotidyltransferase family protein [Nitrososphaerota archaeon]
MTDQSQIDIIIFCAGRGKRLQPLTDNLPKALVPVLGVPLLDYHLSALSVVGVRRVICVTGYKGSQIHDHILSGHAFGLSVEFAHQVDLRGTGDALVTAIPLVESEVVGVLYADVFFKRAVDTWKRVLDDRSPKMVCAEVENAGSFGRVITRTVGGGLFLDTVVEKDGISAPGLVNAGLYLLPKDIVTTLGEQPPGRSGEIELPQAVVVHSQARHQPVRVVTTQGWADVGTPEGLRCAEALAASR